MKDSSIFSVKIDSGKNTCFILTCIKYFHNTMLNSFPCLPASKLLLGGKTEEKLALFSTHLWVGSDYFLYSFFLFLFHSYTLRKWRISESSNHTSFWQMKRTQSHVFICPQDILCRSRVDDDALGSKYENSAGGGYGRV